MARTPTTPTTPALSRPSTPSTPTATVARLRLGALLRQAREAVVPALFQGDLAARAGIAGGQSTISKYERGEQAPGRHDLETLLQELGIAHREQLCAVMRQLQAATSQR